MNPILVMCTGLGYYFNFYRGQAAGARGRGGDHDPPHALGVPPGAPPELHRLLRAGAGRHDRPRSRSRPSTRRASPRTSGTGTSTGPATPTTASTRSTCGTGARTACSTCGRVIIVGRRPEGRAPPRLHPGVHHGRRAGDGHRRRRAATRPSPTCTRRRCCWRTCTEALTAVARRAAGLPAPLKARKAADRAVRRRPPDHGQGQPAERVGRLPVPPPDRPSRRRGAARASRRSAPTSTPTGPGAARPASPGRSSSTGRCAWPCRRWPHPRSRGIDRLADLRALDTSKNGTSSGSAGRHLHAQPPQPPRHAAGHHRHPRAVARTPRRRRGGRLLLHHARHERGVGPGPRRVPGRPQRRRTGARPTWPGS